MVSESERAIMNINDACNYLGISRLTMYRLIKEKKIEYSKIGQGRGTYRFRKESLDNYIDTNKVAVGSGKE